MIVEVNGRAHRIFFQHEEVPNRYRGKNAGITHRTLCRFEVKVDGVTSPDGKTVWRPLAEGVVYRNHRDIPRKADGVRHAFSAMMRDLADNSVYESSVRADIARQFLASRPRPLSMKDLKRIVRAQKEIISQLQARVKGLED